jgi:hypothetical protein
VESDHDPDNADNADGNEEGGEEEQLISDDKEGSTSKVSQGEEDEDAKE